MDPDSRWILEQMVAHRPTRAQSDPLQRLLAFLPSADGAERLAALPSLAQRFIQRWLDTIVRIDPELARIYAQHVLDAFDLMPQAGVEQWLIKAMDAYDKRGLGVAVAVFEDLPAFAHDYAEHQLEARLDTEQKVLQALVLGLGGRPLSISAGEQIYTDTDHIYLPAHLKTFRTQARNRDLYRAMAVFLWAQNVYGSWRVTLVNTLLQRPASDWPIYAGLERVRIEACLQRDLPGLARLLASFSDETPTLTGAWQAAAAHLQQATTSAMDSLHWLDRLAASDAPAPPCYQGECYPQRVATAQQQRLQREQRRLQQALLELQPLLDAGMTNSTQGSGGVFTLAPAETGNVEQTDPAPALMYGGQVVSTPLEIRQLLISLQQDLGPLTDTALVAGSGGAYDAGAGSDAIGSETPLPADSLHYADGALLYPEWDYQRQRYRDNYCVLREHTVPAADPAFVRQTLRKYRGPLQSIKRSFEAVLDEDLRLRRQADGDDIDIDALVAARADQLRGIETGEHFYIQRLRRRRNVAVMLMVDMSGSTRGWVNTAEREALVLLCEALETLGDRYAIYGFSGRTHKRCAIYHIKHFEEGYSQAVRARISGIQPQTYTRMGVAIRHLTRQLRTVPARTRLLVTLSDGKPEDYGSYRGLYGIEDTRRALLEARRDAIHAFCITIDSEGGDYLPHMYGAANYAVIDNVRKLPLKVADIYRRLTT